MRTDGGLDGDGGFDGPGKSLNNCRLGDLRVNDVLGCKCSGKLKILGTASSFNTLLSPFT